jgi:hypothetical protein
MLEWVAFGLSLAAYFAFNVAVERPNREGLPEWLFIMLFCHAATFIGLVIMIFVLDDALFRMLATGAFCLGLFLSSRNETSTVDLPHVRNLLNFALPFTLSLFASVEANSTRWRPELRAAQVISYLACYAVTITLPLGVQVR